jgi:hypothetical protein
MMVQALQKINAKKIQRHHCGQFQHKELLASIRFGHHRPLMLASNVQLMFMASAASG